MTLGDLFELSLLAGLFVLLLLMLAGAVRFRPGKLRDVSWPDRLRHLGRYAALRLPIAIGFGLAFFVLGAAGLTLNSHRPPAGNSPVITVPARSGSGGVKLKVNDCDGDLTGWVRTSGRELGDFGQPRVFSDQDGLKPFRMKQGVLTGHQQGRFVISKPLSRRGLLSCYLQLPQLNEVKSGYSVRLVLGDEMEVDTQSSVPPPDSYNQGEWIWRCPAGRSCPGFVAIGYSIEDGTKQVIVLVLASVFGALIALLAGEVLIEWARRRFRKSETGP